MKKGFTLVELLIVVVVLVTLMTITFRLSSIGADQTARNTAVARLQKLENCLSGYYAAFGSYPPVRLHGSRNYKLKAGEYGIQSYDEEDLSWNWFDVKKHKVKSSDDELREWRKVEAACRSQPVRCSFPFPDDWTAYIDEVAKVSGQNFQNVTPGSLSSYGNKEEWRQLQAFKFGLMSYLLPRYMVMMHADETIFNDLVQWTNNNTMPCDPITGNRFDKRGLDDSEQDWDDLREYANSFDPNKLAHVQNIPSQAACARWMPNLEGICDYCRDNQKFFGIDIRDKDAREHTGINTDYKITDLHVLGDEGGDSGSSGTPYILDSVSVYDGFTKTEAGDNLKTRGEFFYYSPPPHQSYVLWSAGPNLRTFPPWVPRESLSADARQCVGYWTEDDIVIMSH